MSKILDTIIARTRTDLAAAKQATPEALLAAQCRDLPPTRDFAAALQRGSTPRARIIAELKRASPSRGVIRAELAVGAVSRELAEHGAAALSVLTEPHFFHGSPAFLREAASAVSIPVLRKDFIIDPYQLYEARLWGADAVLLIAAALAPSAFEHLHRTAREIGLHVLAEVHTAGELSRVLSVGVEVLGINSRDLRTFETSLERTKTLLRKAPRHVLKVAESGIHGRDDITALTDAGADAFLVGERLMAAASPGEALDALCGAQ